MATPEQVRSSLRRVIDPDLGMNVVDLGLIREIEIDDGRVTVRMVFTAPWCPMAGVLRAAVESAVTAVTAGVPVTVEVLNEPWTPPESLRRGGLLTMAQ